MAFDISQGQLKWVAGIDTSRLQQDKNKVKGTFADIGKSTGGLLSPKSLGITALIAGIGKLGKEAFSFSKEFQSALLEVATLSEDISNNFEDVGDQVMRLTTEIPIGAKEAANALYQIVSAGYDGAKGMKILEISAKAAIGGVTDTATAADGITSVLNAFQLGIDEADGVADTFFTTVKLGKTTFGELAASISQVAPLAAASGISFEEISAAIATLTKSGVPTAQAITQIRSAIIGTTEVLGDGAFASNTLQEAFAKVAEQADGSQNKLKNLVGRVEAVNAVLGLTGNNAEVAASDLEAMSNAAGAADTAFEKMNISVDNQIKLLKNELNVLLKTLGDELLNLGDTVIPFYLKKLSELNSADYSGLQKLLSLFLVGKTAYDVADSETKRLVNRKEALEEYAQEVKKYNSNDFGTLLDRENENLQKNIEKLKGLNTEIKLGNQVSQLDIDLTKEAIVDGRKAIQILNDEDEKRIGLIITKQRQEEADKKANKEKKEEILTLEKLKEKLKTLEDLRDVSGASSISSIDEDIKRLQKTIKNFGKEGDTEQVIIKVKELVDVTKKLKDEKWNAALEEVKTIENLSNVKLKLTKEEKINNKAIEYFAKRRKEDAENQIKEREKELKEIQRISSEVYEIGGLFGMAAGAVNGFSEELSTALTTIQNMLTATSNIIEGFATGNYIQAAAGIIQVIGEAIKYINTDERERQQLVEQTNALIQAQNYELEKQIGLLKTLSGENRIQAEQQTLDLIQQQTEALKEQINGYSVEFVRKEASVFAQIMTLGLANVQGSSAFQGTVLKFDISNLQEAKDLLNNTDDLIKQGFSSEDIEQLRTWVDEFENLLEQRRALFEDLIGFSADTIADKIAEGFASGKRSAEDFANDFEKLMADALINVFKQRFLIAQAEKIFDQFGESLFGKGDVTEEDINAFADAWNSLIEGSTAAWDKINEAYKAATGNDLTTAGNTNTPGLAGDIERAITEDSATELVGLWTRTSFDISAALDVLLNIEQINERIAIYTQRTAIAVESLDNKIKANENDRGIGTTLA